MKKRSARDQAIEKVGTDAVDRARRHLWVLTFGLLVALLGAVLVLSRDETLTRAIDKTIPILPSGRLKTALVLMMVVFIVYVIDRERNLQRMSKRVIAQALERERLETQLHYLSDLQNERDANAALIEGAADGIAVVGKDRKLLRFNAALEHLSGVPANSAVGAHASAVLRFRTAEGSELAGSAHPVSRAFGGRIDSQAELRLEIADGSDRWVGVTTSAIGGEDASEPEFVLVIIRDISEMKEMQALQRDFISLVSHELRTPLTAIKGFANMLLRRNDLPLETRANFLATIDAQSDRLARLVDDLLQVSRIEARRLHIESQPLEPFVVLEKLLPQFDAKWHRAIHLDVPRETPMVSADSVRLEEIFINLIDNAVKYSPDLAPVRITARTTASSVEFAVTDKGAGIAATDCARLFQKFQRLSTPETRDVGGTGLGLYIVKSLVDAMGGQIWVESAPGAGSTFTFTLPRARESFRSPESEAVSA